MSDVAYDRTFEQAMSRVESVREHARAAFSKPIYLGVRSCSPYRAVTIGDRYTRAKLVYDDHGALIAVFASSDVLEPKCMVDYDDATVHYGRTVDCTEGDLMFPSGS